MSADPGHHPKQARSVLRRVLSGLLLVLAFYAGRACESLDRGLDHLADAEYLLADIVAVSWAPDGKYGPAFYAAVVRTSRLPDDRLEVFARVHVGGMNYFDDVGKLGVVANRAEALHEWGTITWAPERVYFGSNPHKRRFLSREQIERHR